MKKWMNAIMLPILFLILFPVLPVLAETKGSGELNVNKSSVQVSLHIPQGKTGTITSLRFQMYVTPRSGKMEEPDFQFDSGLKSEVKDVAVRKEDNGSYIVDIILSGKKDQAVLDGSEDVSIGTLSLHPADKNAYEARVGITQETVKETDEETEEVSQPVVEYVDSGGVEAIKVFLANTDPVIVAADSSGGGSSGDDPAKPDDPSSGDDPAKPDDPSSGKDPAKPGDSSSSTEDPSSGTEKGDLDKEAKPGLKVSTETSSKLISFQWDKMKGADGYEICKYNTKEKKYEAIKRIYDAKTTSYSRKFNYGTAYAFRVRAFERTNGGKRLYGSYSKTAKVKTTPAKVAGFKVQFQSASKVDISWKKAGGAKGYRIYRSTKENGKYKLLQTIKDGSVTVYNDVNHKNGKIYYYKIRAYTSALAGGALYGSYSGPVRATVQTPELTALAKNRSKQVTLKWNKIILADGYIVYKYNTKLEKYERLSVLKSPDVTSYTTSLKYGSLATFKVRAYEWQKDKSVVYGWPSQAARVKAAPAKVAAVTAKSRKKSQITLKWEKVRGASVYQIYRSAKKDGTYKRVASVKGSVLTYTDKEPESGKTYYYKVRAYTKNGEKVTYGKFSSPKGVKSK